MMSYIHTYMRTNLYSARNRENESEAVRLSGSSMRGGGRSPKRARKILLNVSENKSRDRKLKFVFGIHENALDVTR